MKVINIHGYHGNPENSAYTALNELKVEIIPPYLDYDSETPDNILENLCKLIKENNPDIIVGTSLGGFFATILSVRTDIPAILINPALMPFLHLPRLGYKGDVKAYISLFGELAGLKTDKIHTIIGGSDDVIDTHDFTKNLLYNEKFRTVPEGKHSGATLPLKEYFTYVLSNY